MTPLRLGLVGAGIAHSLSPALYGHFLRQAGLDGSYALLAAPNARAAEHWLEVIRAGRLCGVNVTTPHKALAARWVAIAEPVANTVYRQGSTLRACNTDGPGLLDALVEPLVGVRTVVLGSGGAALACVPALVSAGARVTVCGRNADSTVEIARATGVAAAAWGDSTALTEAELVVQLSRFGHGEPGPCRQPEVMAWLPWPAWVRCQTRVVDAVYARGARTWFEQLAAQAGVIGDRGFGAQMLAAQAARSFERFTGNRPDWRMALAATSYTSG